MNRFVMNPHTLLADDSPMGFDVNEHMLLPKGATYEQWCNSEGSRVYLNVMLGSSGMVNLVFRPNVYLHVTTRGRKREWVLDEIS